MPHRQHRHRHPRSAQSRSGGSGQPTCPASWPGLNSLSGDAAAYRLPAYAELAQLPAWAKTARGTIWTYDEAGGYRLYQPDGIPHPHSPAPAQLQAYQRLIIDRTYLVLHLAANTEVRLPRLLLYGHLATREDLADRPEFQLIQALDLLATIDAAAGRDRDLLLARAHYLADGLGLALDLAGDRVRARDLARDRAVMLAQRVGFGFDVALARDAAFYLDRALAVVGDRDLVGDLAEGLDRGLAHGLTYGLTDDLARLLSLDLARALDRDLARALDRADALDLALDRADVLDRDLARALDRDRDLNFARARACALARDLAVARLVQPGRMRQEVIWAGLGLLGAWAARLARSEGRETPLRAFVTESLADCARFQPQDDPPAALERVIGMTGTRDEDPWAHQLLSGAKRRSRHYEPAMARPPGRTWCWPQRWYWPRSWPSPGQSRREKATIHASSCCKACWPR